MTQTSDTTEVTIYGASDDLVEIEGCKSADEFLLPDGDMFVADLIAPNGEQLRFHVIYSANGCWHVAVGQVDEDVALPAWPLRFTQEDAGYSTKLTVTAPAGTRLAQVSPQ